MKRIFAFTWLVFALSTPTLPAAPAPLPADGRGIQGEGTPFVSARAAHQKVWSKVVTTTLPGGRVRYETNVAYIEMAAGMHYPNPDPNQPGQWLESRDEIELFQDGAIGRQGPFQVIWAPNLATPGCIDLMTPDQKRFRTHVLGLALYDSATGHSELIAEVQDCLGELEGANQIIYRDAFDGVSGSVRYTLTRNRFEQDIILYEGIVLPPNFNKATTRLEIWSEMIAPEEPVITTRPMGGMDDATLDFGAARIGPGRAFSLEDPQGRTWSAPMMKSWVKPEPGRTFLIEAIGFETVQPQLDLLPARPQGAALGVPPAAGGVRRQMALNSAGQRVFPARTQIAKARGKIQHARLAPPSPLRGERAGVRGERASLNTEPRRSPLSPRPSSQRGLVLDYSLVLTTSNVVFKGDTTWFISGNLTLTGSNVLEGGTVLKSTNGATLTIAGTLECRTDAYLPATLTSWCDDGIGSSITGSTGNPFTNYAASAALKINYANSDLRHLRVAHAATGFQYEGWSGTQTLAHAQFVHCQRGVDLAYTILNARNVLMVDVLTNISTQPVAYSTTVYGEHLTLCRADRNAHQSDYASLTINFKNSLLVGVTNWYSTAYSYTYCGSNSDPAAVFQTVGASSAYLLNNTYRNAGTTNIDATLLAALRQRTTYPPVVLSNTTISLDTTLYPQAQRDTDAPDLGYHPAVLDYVAGGVVLTNATLTLAAGTALGVFTPSNRSGLLLLGGHIVSEGTPARPNHIARYNMVQEQINTLWLGNEGTFCTAFYGTPAASSARFRFTGFNWPAGTKVLNDFLQQDSTFTFTDCALANASLLLASRAAAAFTNCLLDRVGIYLEDVDFDHPFTARNCLFREGSLALGHYGSTTWEFKDNLFDNTTISQDGDVTANYNAYTTNLVRTNLTARLVPQGANDVKLAVTNFAFQTGPLGRYYQPSGSLLINAGSVSDAATGGFYHYSTITNGTKEANTVLDISFHYLSGSGWGTTFTSADGDGDGWADYFEDTNGSGAVNSGETDWSSASDRGLRVQITNPRNNQILP